MRAIERVLLETADHHVSADEDVLQLLGSVTATDYRQFLERSYGFVAPLERSLAATRGLDRIVDTRRFCKAELLRRDLQGFRVADTAIEELPQCAIPPFDTPEVALGWAFVVERSTLSHGGVFRHLASVMPGDVAFTSAYLKVYFGAVGENWKSFADAFDGVAVGPQRLQHAIDAARAAFRLHRAWCRLHEEHLTVTSEGDRREQNRHT
jgi:heme oxygenase